MLSEQSAWGIHQTSEMIMTDNKQVQSAQIIQFPLGGRRGVAAGFRAQAVPASDLNPKPVVSGSITGGDVRRVDTAGWYHEAALHDVDQAHRH